VVDFNDHQIPRAAAQTEQIRKMPLKHTDHQLAEMKRLTAMILSSKLDDGFVLRACAVFDAGYSASPARPQMPGVDLSGLGTFLSSSVAKKK
jgi:hypothetical protein